MPTAKTKGASTTYHYQPVSEYDNDTLAQKREYWRTKKREQRARLSEHRRRSRQDRQGKKPVGVNAPAVENNSFSDHRTAASCPLTTSNESFKTASSSLASQNGTTVANGSAEDTKSQRERWLETVNLNKALLQLSRSSRCVSAKAAGSEEAAAKCLTRCVKKTVTSVQLAAPPVKATTTINGSSARMELQPCAPMQRTSVAEPEHTAQVEFRIRPRLLAAKVNAGIILTPSSGPPSKAEGKETNTSPSGGTKSALVTSHTANSAGSTQPSLDPEEEKTARRREHWRIKKREQRAKLAKAREKTHVTEVLPLRQTAQNTRVPDCATSRHSVSQTCLQEIGQKQCCFQVKSSFRTAKRKHNKLQIGRNSSDKSINLMAYPVKKSGEAQRKLQTFAHLSNVSRGIARYKIPRKKFIEVQKNLISQRNRRCLSPMLTSVFGSRNVPKIDPSDAPEQKIAKQREYWRNKKREQRAKLSYEVKAQLKEKDSLMRRVKRYQKILEELKCARAQAQSAGSGLTLASETIGGFIKEDGTMTNNVPQVSAYLKTTMDKHSTVTAYQLDTKQKRIAPLCAKQPAISLRSSGVKVSAPPPGQSPSKALQLVSLRRGTQLEGANSTSGASGQLTLTHHPASPVAGSATEHNQGGCVMKMAISNSAPCVNTELTEEERMAKKREYWRMKKREQRAARAAQLKRGLLQAKISAAFNKRKVQKLVAATVEPLVQTLASNNRHNAQPGPDNTSTMPHASEIKQEIEALPEVDLNPYPDRDIKPPTTPTPPPEPRPPEPDSASSADSQTTTLLAVASMKKLLEESLTRVSECKSEVASDAKVEPVEGDLESETKPDLSQLSFTKEEAVPTDVDPMVSDTKSWQRDVHRVSIRVSSTSHNPEEASHTSAAPPSPPSSKALPVCAHSSQTPSHSEVINSTVGPSLPLNQRLCLVEPPKLHHLPVGHQDFEPRCQAAQHFQSSSSSSGGGGLSSLQKKREYWKLMKRQQRARLRARQAERRGGCSGSLPEKHTQAFNVTVCRTVEGVDAQAATPAMQPETCAASSSDKLHCSLPVTAVAGSPKCELHTRDTEHPHYPQVQEFWREEASSGPQLHVHSRTSTSTDSSPFLPALKPPDNPLFSIDLLPIEPAGQTPDSSFGPVKMPHAHIQKLAREGHEVPTTLSPARTTMVPPKLNPGDCEEEFLRRRREYWRIKKKEQRAKKAKREKVGAQRRTSTSGWRPILPSQDIPIQPGASQDCGQWVTSEGASQCIMSAAADADVGSFPYLGCSRSTMEGEAGLFASCEGKECEDGPPCDATWRQRYLMDYDPLNQLLVCMVCGELQYSHSVEGVRGHIDEAHPDTLGMDEAEKRRILEAWDEQVSQREQFFISQLQQQQ